MPTGSSLIRNLFLPLPFLFATLRYAGAGQVQTLLQGVHIREENDSLPVAVKRQTTAFPPNFVHSLDSTHMMMTAIEMDKVGVPFAAVHDSYWVHAGNVDVMNDQLRQVFMVYEGFADGKRARVLPRMVGLDLVDTVRAFEGVTRPRKWPCAVTSAGSFREQPRYTRDTSYPHPFLFPSYHSPTNRTPDVLAVVQCFVDLYSGPILEDLYDSLRMRYPTLDFPPIPERGALVLDDVKDSKYFFN